MVVVGKHVTGPKLMKTTIPEGRPGPRALCSGVGWPRFGVRLASDARGIPGGCRGVGASFLAESNESPCSKMDLMKSL